MHAASAPHAFMGITKQGFAAIVKTRGHHDVHVILRGGSKGMNYDANSVLAATAAIKKACPNSHPFIIVDCSRASYSLSLLHLSDNLVRILFALFLPACFRVPADGNSQKNHNNQPKVVSIIAEQLRASERTITSVMIESNIRAG